MLFGRTSKSDVINILGKKRAYSSYLEICTPTTGGRFSQIDASVFPSPRRLMYHCPESFDDGLPLPFRSPDFDIRAPLDALMAEQNRHDLIMVDPYHEYETSIRDIELATRLLAERGAIVVHDCLPKDIRLVSPRFQQGFWCGLTFKAFLDLVLSRENFSYLTVDTDFGCGVITIPEGASEGFSIDTRRPPRSIVDQWFKLSADDDLRALYRFFWANRNVLLNLVSVREFKKKASQ